MAEKVTLTDEEIGKAAAFLVELLAREEEIKAQRVETERVLAEAFSDDCPLGSQKTIDKAGIKFTVKRELSYKADMIAMAAKLSAEEVALASKTKTEFNESLYKKLEAANPKAFKKVQEFVTVTEAKPYVRVVLPTTGG